MTGPLKPRLMLITLIFARHRFTGSQHPTCRRQTCPTPCKISSSRALTRPLLEAPAYPWKHLTIAPSPSTPTSRSWYQPPTSFSFLYVLTTLFPEPLTKTKRPQRPPQQPRPCFSRWTQLCTSCRETRRVRPQLNRGDRHPVVAEARQALHRRVRRSRSSSSSTIQQADANHDRRGCRTLYRT